MLNVVERNLNFILDFDNLYLVFHIVIFRQYYFDVKYFLRPYELDHINF